MARDVNRSLTRAVFYRANCEATSLDSTSTSRDCSAFLHTGRVGLSCTAQNRLDLRGIQHLFRFDVCKQRRGPPQAYSMSF